MSKFVCVSILIVISLVLVFVDGHRANGRYRNRQNHSNRRTIYVRENSNQIQKYILMASIRRPLPSYMLKSVTPSTTKSIGSKNGRRLRPKKFRHNRKTKSHKQLTRDDSMTLDIEIDREFQNFKVSFHYFF